MTKRRFIILQGIQGCGKTTWARKFVEESPETRIRVNRDEIRKMLGKYWVLSREDLVTDIQDAAIKSAMDRGYDVVVDNMNLSVRDMKHLGEILTYHNCNYEYEVEHKDFFNVSLEECIKRDLKRNEPIGANIIRTTYEKHKIAHGESIFHV